VQVALQWRVTTEGPSFEAAELVAEKPQRAEQQHRGGATRLRCQ
jgi:hypothetical protein